MEHNAPPTADTDPRSVIIYHERQSRQLCALHALNNLLQDQHAFRKSDLDEICRELAPEHRIFSPHRSSIGLGCYDVNVIIAALAKKDLEIKWFDKRKKLSNLNLDKIFGFILNVAHSSIGGPLARLLRYIPEQIKSWTLQKHWIAIRKIGSHYYYNLDSKLPGPYRIGNDQALLDYLKLKSARQHTEILIVVRSCDSEDGSWFINEGAD